MPKKHARLSASSSERWRNCTGSVLLIETLPPTRRDRQTIYAYRGTILHEIAETALFFGEFPEVGTIYKDLDDSLSYELTDEDIEGVQVYINTIKSYKAQDILWEATEIALPFDDVHQDLGGTADYACLTKEGILAILDFKSGVGVMVNPDNNPQAIQYAVGVLLHLKQQGITFSFIEEVHIIIVQPFASYGEKVKLWKTDVSELIMQIGTLAEIADKVNQNPVLVPGEWCRWCPASAVCPALNDISTDLVVQRVSSTPSPVDMTPDEMGSVLSRFQLLRPWIDEIYRLALSAAEKGVKIPGMKLVEKKAIRKWGDEHNVLAIMREIGVEDPFIRKLMSPAQAEKTLGKRMFKELENQVVKASSGHNLVPVVDEVKGPDLTPELPSPQSLGLSVEK